MRTTIRWIIGHLSVWDATGRGSRSGFPRAIPEDLFDTLFAALSSDRDRALVAFWISSGVRASELLGVRECDVDPGQQLITVVRKGTRAVEQVPASADAFVWLRLYQEQLRGEVPLGRTQPLWWTLRRPRRPLNYHAAHRMFERANATLGSELDSARLTSQCSEADGQRPELVLGGGQRGVGARTFVDDRNLSDTR